MKDFLKDDAAKKAIDDLRNGCAQAAALHTPNFDNAADWQQSGCPFELYCDASDIGWGCCLAQRPQPDNGPRPIAVYSRSWSATEAAWSTLNVNSVVSVMQYKPRNI